MADNTINQVEPQLDANFRPVSGSNILTVTTYAVPNFTWDTFTPPVETGTLTNTLGYDRAGVQRVAAGPPGAYTAAPSRVYLPLIRR